MTDLIWKTEKRVIGELSPADYNPRKISDDQKKHLRKSLEKFGLAEIPVINTDNTIVAGHQRISILKDLFPENHIIEVRVPNRMLTLEEEKEYNIRSNKNTGDWDYDKLHIHFKDEELLEFGFEEYQLNNEVVDIDSFKDDDWSEKEKKQKEVQCPHCGEKFNV